MSYPPPLVLIKDFNSSSIEVRILFWIEDFKTWTQIKSDTIEAITKAFKKDGVQISQSQEVLNNRDSVPEEKKDREE
jgi:small-conductance mechanosensitive channel